MAVSVSDPFNAVRDQALPSLSLAIDPAEAKRQIKRVMRPHIHNGDRIRLREIRVVRHKPGKRCLIEYDLKISNAQSPAETITLIGKIRAGRFGMRDYRLQHTMWRAGLHDRSHEWVSVPQPIGQIPRLRMWLQRKISGQTATDLLGLPGAGNLVRRIAEAAHQVHRTAVAAARTHRMTDELCVLRKCLDIVTEREPSWKERIDGIWNACLRLKEDTPEPLPTGIHRDFYADQVIVSGQRLYLIDFDLYCYGDPALDIGNFIGHITEQSLRTFDDPTRLSHLELAMEDRFAELAGEATRVAVRTYATLTLVRHIYLSMQFPDRQRFTEPLVELCEQRLGLNADRPVI